MKRDSRNEREQRPRHDDGNIRTTDELIAALLEARQLARVTGGGDVEPCEACQMD